MIDALLTAATMIYVRELSSNMTAEERALLRFRACDEAVQIRSHLEMQLGIQLDQKAAIRVTQRNYLTECLTQSNGNKTAAAKRAGMSYKGFCYAVGRLGVVYER